MPLAVAILMLILRHAYADCHYAILLLLMAFRLLMLLAGLRAAALLLGLPRFLHCHSLLLCFFFD